MGVKAPVYQPSLGGSVRIGEILSVETWDGCAQECLNTAGCVAVMTKKLSPVGYVCHRLQANSSELQTSTPASKPDNWAIADREVYCSQGCPSDGTPDAGATYCPAGYTNITHRFNLGLGKIIIVTEHQHCADRCAQFSGEQFMGGCKGYVSGMYMGMLFCRSYGGNLPPSRPCPSWGVPWSPGLFSGGLGSKDARTNQVNVGGQCCVRIAALPTPTPAPTPAPTAAPSIESRLASCGYPSLSTWFKDESSTIYSPSVDKMILRSHALRCREGRCASRSTYSYNTAIFPDFDGDGTLDFMTNNHGHDFGMPVCAEFGLGGNPTSLDSTSCAWNRTDDPEGGYQYDDHSTAVLDIDNDGHLDLYMNAGGGSGVGVGTHIGSSLYWGEPAPSGSIWAASGGVEAAVSAGLDGGLIGRGSNQYWADFNGDGLLDVCLINKARKDAIDGAYSKIFYNNGNRTFTEDPVFAEYVSAAILGSSTGVLHGGGTDFIVIRGKCLWPRLNVSEFSTERIAFCAARPQNSWAVYRFSKVTQSMEMVSSTSGSMASRLRGSSTAVKGLFSIETADINGDGRMDFLLECHNGIFFLISGDAEAQFFTDGAVVADEIMNPPGWSLSMARLGDFNLDGSPDIMVVYQERRELNHTGGQFGPYRTVMYTKDPDATAPPYWMEMQAAGEWPALNTQTLASDELPLEGDRNEYDDWYHDAHGDDDDSHEDADWYGDVHGGDDDSHEDVNWYHDSHGDGDGDTRYDGIYNPNGLITGTAFAIEDVAAVDYNNDGFLDISFVHGANHIYLTNTFVPSGGTCEEPQFLAVVIRSMIECGNIYGIGSTVRLSASNMGPARDQDHWLYHDVNAFSHGTTTKGGATDHRIIFGLGATGVPNQIRVKW